MIAKTFAFLALLVSTAVPAADWQLTGLVYNDWCPPAALGQRLCVTGGPFDASPYIGNPAEVGSLFVNQLGQDELGLKFGSRISVPSPSQNNPNKKFSYILGEVFPTGSVWDFHEDVSLVDLLGQEVRLTVLTSNCYAVISGNIAEANFTTQKPARRNATMTFANSYCD